jgi:hypothetical protein
MKTTVRCNTCKFGEWGFRGPIPCTGCIGFHKWQPKLKHLSAPKPCPPMIRLECGVCDHKETTFKHHPMTGFVYNSDWVIRCCVCSSTMKEVI